MDVLTVGCDLSRVVSASSTALSRKSHDDSLRELRSLLGSPLSTLKGPIMTSLLCCILKHFYETHLECPFY